MRLSTRNQLQGTVDGVTHGEVMSLVKVTLKGGDTVTAAITAKRPRSSTSRPGLR